jgi:hypothetical protein
MNPARQSPRLLRRRRPRHRDRRARARAARRADLRAPRSRAQQVRRRRPARQRGAVFVDGPRRGARRRHRDLLGARRFAGGAARGRARGLRVFDATCPLVTKVHVEVARMRDQGREIVMIGHAGTRKSRARWGRRRRHVSGRDRGRRRAARRRDPQRLAYVTQTTLSIDDAARHRSRAEAALSRRSSGPARTTSATPRRIARTR